MVHEQITQKERERRAISYRVKLASASALLLSLLLICIAWTLMTDFYGVSANPSQYRHVYLMIVLCFLCNLAGLAVLLLGPEVAKSKRFSAVNRYTRTLGLVFFMFLALAFACGYVYSVCLPCECEDADLECLAEKVYEEGVHQSLIWSLVCNLCWAIAVYILRLYYSTLALVLQMNFLEDQPFEGFQMTAPMSANHADTASLAYPLKNLDSPSNTGGSRNQTGVRFY